MLLSVPVTYAILAALVAAAVVAVLRWRAEKRSGVGLTPGFKGWLLILLAVLWLSVPRLLANLFDLLLEIERNGRNGGLAFFDVAYSGVLLVLVAVTAALLTRRARAFLHVQAALLAWVMLYVPLVLLLLVTVSPSLFAPPLGLREAVRRFPRRRCGPGRLARRRCSPGSRTRAGRAASPSPARADGPSRQQAVRRSGSVHGPRGAGGRGSGHGPPARHGWLAELGGPCRRAGRMSGPVTKPAR